MLNIYQEYYISSLGKAAGVRVVINSQKEMPFPEEEGLHAQPGTVTSIGMKQVDSYTQTSTYALTKNKRKT